MNQYQRLVAIAAVINIMLMMLFPPFNELPLARGALPSFDGFHPLVARFGLKPIATDLLSIQIFFVIANALAAFLCLRNEPGKRLPEFRYERAIGIFVVVNAAVVLLFPPFEPYPSLLRSVGSSFDSFNFILGNRVSRPIFVPLLYLECVFIAVNALSMWLLFNTVKRKHDERRAQREQLLQLAEDMDEEELAQLTSEMGQQYQYRHANKGKKKDALGRKQERRVWNDPKCPGPERRRGRDRRQLK